MEVVKNAAAQIGIAAACAVLDVPRASYYRALAPVHGPWPAPSSPRALSEQERQEVLDVLREERFVDKAPGEVFATLLDEGRYICSERTMYRILAANDEVRERRDQLRHPSYAAPELLATKPNELWSWDITKLKGPQKGSYFHLYVILDVFSRYVVGWMVAHRESSGLAKKLISETCVRQGIEERQLTLHADRGSSMRSKPVALLLSDLGVTKTHSRPHVSDDNPFSESQFKTLKYRPDFPERFGSIKDARSFMAEFFRWYNEDHRHTGIAMLTPKDVHHGLASERQARRAEVLLVAYEAHPERFVCGAPQPDALPTEVWINKPRREEPIPQTEAASATEVATTTEPASFEDAPAEDGRLRRSRAKSGTPEVPRAAEPLDSSTGIRRPAAAWAQEGFAQA